ncbi:hypothetical protein RugamoR57_03880 [Duganella caerulea]
MAAAADKSPRSDELAVVLTGVSAVSAETEIPDCTFITPSMRAAGCPVAWSAPPPPPQAASSKGKSRGRACGGRFLRRIVMMHPSFLLMWERFHPQLWPFEARARLNKVWIAWVRR